MKLNMTVIPLEDNLMPYLLITYNS